MLNITDQRANSTMKAKSRPKPVHPPRGQHVLVVEDESDLQQLLRYNLQQQGYQVSLSSSGERALELVLEKAPDLILLDLMLPGLDGLSVCTQLRRDPRTASIPVVMLTAKGEETDIVVGLELGADDYVTKPFSPRVLLARISAVLRRQIESGRGTGESDPDDAVIRRGALTIDGARHRVSIDDHEVQLTHSEFKALRLLARRPGRVFTRQQIIAGVHGEHVAVTDRSVDVMVVSMRRKLAAHGEWLETVRGVGYRFKE